MVKIDGKIFLEKKEIVKKIKELLEFGAGSSELSLLLEEIEEAGILLDKDAKELFLEAIETLREEERELEEFFD